MKFRNILKFYDYIFIAISPVFFIFGATQMYENYILPLSIVSLLILFGLWLVRGRKIVLPKCYIWYIVFLVSLAIHTQIFNGKIVYVLLFLSGGLYWLGIYNLKVTISKYFLNFLIILGLFMLGIRIGSIFFGITSANSNSLFLPSAVNEIHNHLGDLWGIILAGLIYRIIHKFSKWDIPLAVIGFIVLIFSFSRSAILAFAVGSAYAYFKSGKAKIPRWALITSVFITVALFIFSSSLKTTLFSRPYMIEAVNSLVRSPLGIGVGNFGKISHESSAAHNIILEIATGMGMFSIFFVIWLVNVSKLAFKKSREVLFATIFVAVFTNFFFDTTYTIPTTLWIWFSALALISE